jgi:hypothetical protein
MNPIEARRQAEMSFKHAEHTLDRQPTMPRYEAEAVRLRAKTARLKVLRLAKERSGMSADRWPRAGSATSSEVIPTVDA